VALGGGLGAQAGERLDEVASCFGGGGRVDALDEGLEDGGWF